MRINRVCPFICFDLGQVVSDHRPRPQTPVTIMSNMDEVKDDRKLKGKTNFVSWKREFERAAKTTDIFEYLTGEETVPAKPKKEDYFVKLIEVDIHRPARGKKASQTFTPSSNDDDETDDVQTRLSTNNALRWQIDYTEHKNAKGKMKLAGKTRSLGL